MFFQPKFGLLRGASVASNAEGDDKQFHRHQEAGGHVPQDTFSGKDE
jgi:hypothetical protein